MSKIFNLPFCVANFCPLAVQKPEVTASAKEELRFSFSSGAETFTGILSTSIADIAQDWCYLPGEDIFVDPAFLSAIEAHGPARITPYYLLIYREEVPVLGAVCCDMPFEAAENIKLPRTATTRWGRWINSLRIGRARRITARVLTVGQLWLTGEHALRWSTQLPTADVGKVLIDALETAAYALRQKGRRIHALMIKDILPARAVWTKAWQQRGYNPMRFEPNMVQELPADWKTMEDYLAALHSKARVRVKRARKKQTGLYRYPLDRDELVALQPQMHALYRGIADQADFNLFFLPPDYFLGLYDHLGAAFSCYGYFKKDELVAFYTTIQNGTELDAHFLGMEQTANGEHQVYLNILLDILEEGIALGMTQIVYARTAPEIKSSLGAHPVAYDLYLKSLYPVINWLIPPFVRWLAPASDAWQPRQPFKEGRGNRYEE